MISKKKILILGANGIVGNKIFQLLKSKKYNVSGLSHQNSLEPLIIQADYLKINNQAKKILSNTDIVINCIGEVYDQKKMLYKNFSILKKIIKFLNKKKKTIFIHLSTCGVYGDLKLNKISEESIPNPVTYYAKTKYQGEIFLKDNLKNNVSLIILRPTQIIGKNFTNGLIKKLDFLIKKNLFIYIDNKKCIYSYIFFEDLFNIIEYFIKKKVADDAIFNVSNYSTYEKIIKSFCEFYGVKKNFFSLNQKFSRILLSIIIIILNVLYIIYKHKFRINKTAFEILTSKKIFKSDKIKEYFNIIEMKEINKNNLNCLL